MSRDFDRVVFQIGSLTKSGRQGRPFQSITFSKYTESSKLDVHVILCLKAYIEKTRILRTTKVQKRKLFIACVRPHKPVVSCTLSRWLKVVMAQAGVDVDKYKAHSVRGASTSKANKLGLSAQQIMDRAKSAKASTFQ